MGALVLCIFQVDIYLDYTQKYSMDSGGVEVQLEVWSVGGPRPRVVIIVGHARDYIIRIQCFNGGMISGNHVCIWV
jgi:hypothetical protein